MSHLNPQLSWISGYVRRSEGQIPGTYVAEYRLSFLMRKGYIDRTEAQAFWMRANWLIFTGK